LIAQDELLDHYLTTFEAGQDRLEMQRITLQLAAIGRMTLTNYLLQSVILTTIFYHYGLGYYDKIGPAMGILLIEPRFHGK
jgi:uncharacterized protein